MGAVDARGRAGRRHPVLTSAVAALAAAGVGLGGAAAPAPAADPAIAGVPDNTWQRSSSPPIEFRVRNGSTNKRAHINSLHIRTNVPNSAAVRPLNVYRTTADGRTAAETPNCFAAASGELDCDSLDAAPGETLTVDLTTKPDPYPDGASITVWADAKVETAEITGDPITLSAPPAACPSPPCRTEAAGALLGPGDTSVSPGDKKYYKKKAHRHKLGAGAAASGAGIVLIVPEPAISKIFAFVALVDAAVHAIMGEIYDEWADDPPDARYKRVAVARIPRAQVRLSGSARDRRIERLTNSVFQSALARRGLFAAFLASLERAEGAVIAGDATWVHNQLGYAARYARRLAAEFARDGQARTRLVRALRGTGLDRPVSAAQQRSARSRLLGRQGRALRRLLAQAGLLKVAGPEIAADLSATGAASLTGLRLSSVLLSPDVAAEDARVAALLRRAAHHLSP